MAFAESMVSRLVAGLLALALPFAVISAPLVTGSSVPVLVLDDQNGKKVSIETGTRAVLFAADKVASDFVNETLSAQPAGVLDRMHAVYFADISAMPALVTKLFALPALRELPFAVGLGREAGQLADLPRQKGAATLLRITDGKLASIEYLRDANQLRQALGIK